MPPKRNKPFGKEPDSIKVISATVYNYGVDFPAGGGAFIKDDDVFANNPLPFSLMNPPIPAGPGTGQNSMQALGVFHGQSGHAATTTDPYQRNFYMVKVDHAGFNTVQPSRFDDGRRDYTYAQMSSTVVEIVLPEAPIADAIPTTVTRPTNISYAQLTGMQKQLFDGGYDNLNWAWNETRPCGQWQYIEIPAGFGCSLKMGQYCTYAGWQQLLDQGLVPKICKKQKYFIRAKPVGLNGVEMDLVAQKLSALNSVGIPASNAQWSGYQQGTQSTPHKKQETDWICQYSTLNPGDTYIGAKSPIADLQAQGFDVMAYGSGIVFQFLQYAPPTNDDDDPHLTASCQIIPVQLTVHSKCHFTKKKSQGRDLYQLTSLPLAANLS